jgi:uncharacterized protein
MLAFQKYQLEFTAHIRNPSANKKPAKVKDARIAVYREIVFNNMFGSVSACFPVCKSILNAREWKKLVREFFAQHQASTPIFREIPQQFLEFLKTVENLPEYFQALAHYEWVELAVASQLTETIKLSKKTDFLNEKPVLAPAHMLLKYDFAVHKISKKYLPKTAESTHLLVFRNTENQVKFIELNPMTFELLCLIDDNGMAGEQALVQLAEHIKHQDTDAIIQFGGGILADLARQQAIIGST